jgi:hypothetical protein
MPTKPKSRLLLTTWSLVVFFIGCTTSHLSDSHLSEKGGWREQTSEHQAVNFCDLVNHANLYENKMISTRAIAVAAFESAYLYDSLCDSKEQRVYFEYENEQAAKDLEALLGDFVRGNVRKADVTIIGRFESSNKEGYGHLNSFRFRFTIIKVVKGESVSS